MKSILLTLAASAVFTLSAGAQAIQLANNQGLVLLGLLNSNRAVFYAKSNGQLWVSDGTLAGTQPFTGKVTAGNNPVASVMNGRLYFSGYQVNTGRELWVTDGTDAGTQLLKDINPGASGSDPADRFVVLNNTLYFSAATAAAGRELWKTDGTEAGTVMISDIVPGTAGSNQPSLYKLTAAGNLIFFVASTAAHGEELWRTDGTAAGTLLLQDIRPGAAGAVPMMMGILGTQLIFNADNGVTGIEPWVSNGTPAGTFMLKDIAPATLSSMSDHFTLFKGKLLFVANDFVHGEELWATDGTPAGTTLLKDIEPGPMGSMPVLFNSIQVADQLFFSAYTSASGMELMQTNGTAAGTGLFMDIEPGPANGVPVLLPAYANGYGVSSQLFKGNQFFFSAFTVGAGFELYISDGTVAGTRMVKDLYPGIGDGFTMNGYYITNNAIYFNGDDGLHAGELFKSDGTAAGTMLAAEVNPAGDGEVMPFVIVGNGLLFTGNDGNNPSPALNDLFRLNTVEVVLPVQLISFTGNRSGDRNQLFWQVADAAGFGRFVVERSTDGVHYSAVGEQLWSPSLREYRFEESLLSGEAGQWYYRLRLTDVNGSFCYSPVVIIRTPGKPGAFVKANRNGQEVQVWYTLPAAEANLQVTDVSGRILYHRKITGSSGTVRLWLQETGQQAIQVTVYGTDFRMVRQVL